MRWGQQPKKLWDNWTVYVCFCFISYTRRRERQKNGRNAFKRLCWRFKGSLTFLLLFRLSSFPWPLGRDETETNINRSIIPQFLGLLTSSHHLSLSVVVFPQIEHRPALKNGLVGIELETRDIRFETGDISFEIICILVFCPGSISAWLKLSIFNLCQPQIMRTIVIMVHNFNTTSINSKQWFLHRKHDLACSNDHMKHYRNTLPFSEECDSR